MTHNQMIYGEDRVKARYALEAYILLGVASGQLAWKYGNHWFHEHNGVVLRDGQTLKDLYEERVVLYEKYADITIDEENKNLEETLQSIIDTL